jgi:hypothetical protein
MARIIRTAAVQHCCGERGAEDAGLVELHHLVAAHGTYPLVLAGQCADAGQNLEQGKEERHLDQHGQARGKGVGSVLFVQFHLLLGHRLPGDGVTFALVFFLQLHQVRLQQPHPALGLYLLQEHGNQGGADDQYQPDDGQRPRPAACRRHTEGAEPVMETNHDRGHKPPERNHDFVKKAHTFPHPSVAAKLRPNGALVTRGQERGPAEICRPPLGGLRLDPAAQSCCGYCFTSALP